MQWQPLAGRRVIQANSQPVPSMGKISWQWHRMCPGIGASDLPASHRVVRAGRWRIDLGYPLALGIQHMHKQQAIGGDRRMRCHCRVTESGPLACAWASSMV